MRKLIIMAILLSFLCSISLFASTTGRIAGRVTDSMGRPLAYANVILQGTQIGTQTKENGSFIIINIPPGVYTVIFTAIGYDKYTINGVRVSADGTAPANAKLSVKGVAIEGITVNAKEEKIDKAKVGSGREIRMDQSADVAVRDVEGLIALEAGVTTSGGEIHVRGGRANEVVYSIDGMSVSDPVDGGSALSVDTDAIQDMKIMTGSFSAEYGNAQSGVVNIVTKDGDEYYSGKVELNTDHLFGGMTDNEKSDLKGRNSDLVKFALGGPLLGSLAPSMKPKLTFYVNGAAAWDDGRYRALYKNSPNEDFTYRYPSLANPDSIVSSQLLENQYNTNDPYQDRDDILGFNLGNRNYNSYNLNFKTKYVIDALQNFTIGVRGDHNLSFPYSHQWKYALDHYAYDKTDQRQYIVTYDKSFSPIQMNLKVKASYYDKVHKLGPKGIGKKQYFHMYVNPDSLTNDAYKSQYIDNILNNDDFGYTSIDANGDGIMDGNYLGASFWTYRVQGLEDAQTVEGFYAPGRIFDTFVDDETNTFNFRADLEYQLNSIHLAKTGFELYKHHIVKDQLGGFLSTYEDRRQRYLSGIYNMRNYVDNNPSDSVASVPAELVEVIQTDSTTYIPIYNPEDYLNAAYAASGTRDSYVADPWQGAYYIQDKMEWEGMIVNLGLRADFWYLGKSYDVYKVTREGEGYYSVPFNKKDRMQLMISPRLGVSHPISERDVLRFAYNYQNQLPQMQFIFTSRDSTDVTDHPVVGNPGLEPQITVTYEVGLQHQISEDYVADITAYYKNIYNYVSTKKVRKADNEYYYQYISEDYGSTRGIDLTLEKYMSNFFSANLAYSLAWAQGNNSDVVVQDEQTSLREFPLDWDIRHNLNANLTFRIDRGEEYFIPFTSLILPLDDFSANLTYNISSGSPYTGMTTVGSTNLDTNSKRKDFTQSTNLKLTKTVALSKKMSLRFFLDVQNLFKNKNILTVYPKTGSPYWDDWTNQNITEANTGYLYPEREFVHGLYVRNPGFVDNERNITFGFSYNF